MKNLLIAILMLTGSQAFSCGYYRVQAQVKLVKAYPQLVIHPSTQSEINLTLAFKETPKLSAYIDSVVMAQVYISSVDATLGEVEKIQNIERIFVDVLNPADTSIKLLKYEKCKK